MDSQFKKCNCKSKKKRGSHQKCKQCRLKTRSKPTLQPTGHTPDSSIMENVNNSQNSDSSPMEAGSSKPSEDTYSTATSFLQMFARAFNGEMEGFASSQTSESQGTETNVPTVGKQDEGSSAPLSSLSKLREKHFYKEAAQLFTEQTSPDKKGHSADATHPVKEETSPINLKPCHVEMLSLSLSDQEKRNKLMTPYAQLFSDLNRRKHALKTETVPKHNGHNTVDKNPCTSSKNSETSFKQYLLSAGLRLNQKVEKSAQVSNSSKHREETVSKEKENDLNPGTVMNLSSFTAFRNMADSQITHGLNGLLSKYKENKQRVSNFGNNIKKPHYLKSRKITNSTKALSSPGIKVQSGLNPKKRPPPRFSILAGRHSSFREEAKRIPSEGLSFKSNKSPTPHRNNASLTDGRSHVHKKPEAMTSAVDSDPIPAVSLSSSHFTSSDVGERKDQSLQIDNEIKTISDLMIHHPSTRKSTSPDLSSPLSVVKSVGIISNGLTSKYKDNKKHRVLNKNQLKASYPTVRKLTGKSLWCRPWGSKTNLKQHYYSIGKKQKMDSEIQFAGSKISCFSAKNKQFLHGPTLMNTNDNISTKNQEILEITEKTKGGTVQNCLSESTASLVKGVLNANPISPVNRNPTFKDTSPKRSFTISDEYTNKKASPVESIIASPMKVNEMTSNYKDKERKGTTSYLKRPYTRSHKNAIITSKMPRKRFGINTKLDQEKALGNFMRLLAEQYSKDKQLSLTSTKEHSINDHDGSDNQFKPVETLSASLTMKQKDDPLNTTGKDLQGIIQPSWIEPTISSKEILKLSPKVKPVKGKQKLSINLPYRHRGIYKGQSNSKNNLGNFIRLLSKESSKDEELILTSAKNCSIKNDTGASNQVWPADTINASPTITLKTEPLNAHARQNISLSLIEPTILTDDVLEDSSAKNLTGLGNESRPAETVCAPSATELIAEPLKEIQPYWIEPTISNAEIWKTSPKVTHVEVLFGAMTSDIKHESAQKLDTDLSIPLVEEGTIPTRKERLNTKMQRPTGMNKSLNGLIARLLAIQRKNIISRSDKNYQQVSLHHPYVLGLKKRTSKDVKGQPVSNYLKCLSYTRKANMTPPLISSNKNGSPNEAQLSTQTNSFISGKPDSLSDEGFLIDIGMQETHAETLNQKFCNKSEQWDNFASKILTAKKLGELNHGNHGSGNEISLPEKRRSSTFMKPQKQHKVSMCTSNRFITKRAPQNVNFLNSLKSRTNKHVAFPTNQPDEDAIRFVQENSHDKQIAEKTNFCRDIAQMPSVYPNIAGKEKENTFQTIIVNDDIKQSQTVSKCGKRRLKGKKGFVCTKRTRGTVFKNPYSSMRKDTEITDGSFLKMIHKHFDNTAELRSVSSQSNEAKGQQDTDYGVQYMAVTSKDDYSLKCITPVNVKMTRECSLIKDMTDIFFQDYCLDYNTPAEKDKQPDTTEEPAQDENEKVPTQKGEKETAQNDETETAQKDETRGYHSINHILNPHFKNSYGVTEARKTEKDVKFLNALRHNLDPQKPMDQDVSKKIRTKDGVKPSVSKSNTTPDSTMATSHSTISLGRRDFLEKKEDDDKGKKSTIHSPPSTRKSERFEQIREIFSPPREETSDVSNMKHENQNQLPGRNNQPRTYRPPARQNILPGQNDQPGQYRQPVHQNQSRKTPVMETLRSSQISQSPVKPSKSLSRTNHSPSIKSPAMTNRSPARQNQSPERDNLSPVKRNKSPAVTNRSLARQNRSPDRHNQSPVKQNKPPAMTNRSPVRQNQSLDRHNQSPVKQNKSPAMTNRYPVRQNQSLDRHNQSPVKQNKSPAMTNRPPVRQNQSPDHHNQSPVRQNKSPTWTNNSPARQNQSPDRHNQSPVKQNKSPALTNNSPARQNQSPDPHNQSPVKQNKSPALTDRSPARQNQSPDRHNQSPVKQNKSPAMTNRSPARQNQSPDRHNQSSMKQNDRSPSRTPQITMPNSLAQTNTPSPQEEKASTFRYPKRQAIARMEERKPLVVSIIDEDTSVQRSQSQNNDVDSKSKESRRIKSNKIETKRNNYKHDTSRSKKSEPSKDSIVKIYPYVDPFQSDDSSDLDKDVSKSDVRLKQEWMRLEEGSGEKKTWSRDLKHHNQTKARDREEGSETISEFDYPSQEFEIPDDTDTKTTKSMPVNKKDLPPNSSQGSDSDADRSREIHKRIDFGLFKEHVYNYLVEWKKKNEGYNFLQLEQLDKREHTIDTLNLLMRSAAPPATPGHQSSPGHQPSPASSGIVSKSEIFSTDKGKSPSIFGAAEIKVSTQGDKIAAVESSNVSQFTTTGQKSDSLKSSSFCFKPQESLYSPSLTCFNATSGVSRLLEQEQTIPNTGEIKIQTRFQSNDFLSNNKKQSDSQTTDFNKASYLTNYTTSAEHSEMLSLNKVMADPKLPISISVTSLPVPAYKPQTQKTLSVTTEITNEQDTSSGIVQTTAMAPVKPQTIPKPSLAGHQTTETPGAHNPQTVAVPATINPETDDSSFHLFRPSTYFSWSTGAKSLSNLPKTPEHQIQTADVLQEKEIQIGAESKHQLSSIGSLTTLKGETTPLEMSTKRPPDTIISLVEETTQIRHSQPAMPPIQEEQNESQLTTVEEQRSEQSSDTTLQQLENDDKQSTFSTPVPKREEDWLSLNPLRRSTSFHLPQSGETTSEHLEIKKNSTKEIQPQFLSLLLDYQRNQSIAEKGKSDQCGQSTSPKKDTVESSNESSSKTVSEIGEASVAPLTQPNDERFCSSDIQSFLRGLRNNCDGMIGNERVNGQISKGRHLGTGIDSLNVQGKYALNESKQREEYLFSKYLTRNYDSGYSSEKTLSSALPKDITSKYITDKEKELRNERFYTSKYTSQDNTSIYGSDTSRMYSCLSDLRKDFKPNGNTHDRVENGYNHGVKQDAIPSWNMQEKIGHSYHPYMKDDSFYANRGEQNETNSETSSVVSSSEIPPLQMKRIPKLSQNQRSDHIHQSSASHPWLKAYRSKNTLRRAGRRPIGGVAPVKRKQQPVQFHRNKSSNKSYDSPLPKRKPKRVFDAFQFEIDEALRLEEQILNTMQAGGGHDGSVHVGGCI